MFKEILTFAASACAVAILMAAMTQETKAVQLSLYDDVSVEDSGYTEIMYLYENGVLDACEGRLFRPDEEISTGEFISLLERAFGVSGRIPSDLCWETYESEWFDAVAKDCGELTCCNPMDDTILGYRAAKLTLSILGEESEDLGVLVRTLRYRGFALTDSTEYTLTAALRGYVPQYEQGYEATGGYKMFENLTRTEAAVMVYMTMQEVLK